MGGAGDSEKKDNVNKCTEEENENKNTEEENEDDVKPKPVVIVVKKLEDPKMGMLKSALERQQEQQELSEYDDVILDATPLNSYSPSPDTDSDLTQVEPPLTKFKRWIAENASKAPIPTKEDTPAPTPTRFRLKIRMPKPPEPKPILLKPPMVTYLRPRPGSKPASDVTDDPNETHVSMGPPPEPRMFKTPYETVKDSLTFLKIELQISEVDYEDMLEIEDAMAAEEGYSLARVSPDVLFSMDEVVMELDLFLNSIPETASSDYLKQMLLAFQTRLGLPPQPCFYNLMWTSPAHFMNYLSLVQQASEGFDDDDDPEEEEYDDDDIEEEFDDDDPEEEDCDGAGDNSCGTSANKRAYWVYETGETSAFRVRYDHLPPPSLPFYNAVEILHEFVNRFQNGYDYELDETAFLELQYDLLLPEWFSLFELYRLRSMAAVVHFIHEYFGTSQMSQHRDN